MQKRTKKIVGAVVGGSVLALLAYELWALANDDKEDTLSERYWNLAARYPILPFAMGTLVGGHFNWQSADVYEKFWKEAQEKETK